MPALRRGATGVAPLVATSHGRQESPRGPHPKRPPSGAVPDIKLSTIHDLHGMVALGGAALEKGQALPEAPTREAGEVTS